MKHRYHEDEEKLVKEFKRLGPTKGCYVFEYPNGDRPKFDVMTEKQSRDCEKADLRQVENDYREESEGAADKERPPVDNKVVVKPLEGVSYDFDYGTYFDKYPEERKVETESSD